MNAYQDCYWKYENEILTLGNSRVERGIRICNQGMAPLYLWDKKNHKRWERPEAECPLIALPFLQANLSMEASLENRDGLSSNHLQVRLCWENTRGECLIRLFILYPRLPWIGMRAMVKYQGDWQAALEQGMEYSGAETRYGNADHRAVADAIDCLPLPWGHYTLWEVALLDQSDRHDTLVRETQRPLYTHGWGSEEGNGSLFFLQDRLDDNGVLLVKEAPSILSMLGRENSDLIVKNNRSVQLRGSGLAGQMLDGGEIPVYGASMGVGKKEEWQDAWMQYYQADWHAGEQTRIYSNTWGDRNQDKAVCHDFMLGEIEKAAYLGVQVVQIDDGWQKGHTANSALKKNGVWSGYYAQDPDFWQVNKEKFPQGLRPLVEKAKESGIEMALWFSPDSSHDFENWERDLHTLLSLWQENGIRRFKLDGVRIASKIGEKNFVHLLAGLHKKSQGKICVNQDITAQIRLGQIYFREYGNLFVENRYSDYGSYYPHNTLKNLWQMSRYVPAARLQMECLNRGRNQDKYPRDDPFAPRHYEMDYLFAITLPASPLIWMEMSHLGQADAERLKKIIAAYLPHQQAIIQSRVRPIGQKPDGMSFTGFQMEEETGKGYLVLFREYTKENACDYSIPGMENAIFQMIASNAATKITAVPGGIRAQMDRPRSYAFLRYTR